MDKAEVIQALLDTLEGVNPDTADTDNEGQIIIYTGVYRWSDGSFHEAPEEEV